MRRVLDPCSNVRIEPKAAEAAHNMNVGYGVADFLRLGLDLTLRQPYT